MTSSFWVVSAEFLVKNLYTTGQQGIIGVKMGKTSAALLGLMSLIGLVCACAWAEEKLTADKVVISTPAYEPVDGEFEPSLGTYTYDVSWQGIPAAEAVVTVEHDGPIYRITARARTYSGIDIFYKLRYQAVGEISSTTYRPHKTSIVQKENSKEKFTDIAFEEDGDIRSTRGEKGKTPIEMEFNPQNCTLDPMSAAFLARSLDWRLNETKSFDTFNGKSRYLIQLTAKEKIIMKVNGEDRPVWVIEPAVRNLVNQAQSKKLRSAQIYVTADKAREILQIKSKVFIGTVTTALESFTPPASSPSQTLALRAGQVMFE